MNPNALFGIGTLLSLTSATIFAALFVWPRLRVMDRDVALASLAAPHMFVRFLGLGFLVPGVVSPSLPPAFAVPAAYGDVAAGLLAIAATVALRRRAPGAAMLAWAFNLWGMADFLIAFLEGYRVGLDPGALGATFFIPTAIVPLMLVTHVLSLRLLVQRWRLRDLRGPVADVAAGSHGVAR